MTPSSAVIRLGWYLALGMALFVAVPGEALEYAPPPDDADLQQGEVLYRRDCASCHGDEGEGTRRGPSLSDSGEAANYYYLHTGRMPILSPSDPIRRGLSPYDDEQLTALVAFTSRLGDGHDMPTAPEEVDLARGGEAYRLHCSVCHGAAGGGGALADRRNSPSLHESTVGDVVAAVLAGPGTMPSFEDALDERQIFALAAYVQHLKDPPGTGISIPGHRVGEGLVALVAMALLVVAVRLIGEAA